MNGLKPKVFGIGLVIASSGQKSFSINSQSSFSLSVCGVWWWVSAGPHENMEHAEASLVRKWTGNCKEKEKWQPIQ